MKHTKSPSGKTHRLTDRKGESVTLRYRERPQFDDQVQGDLIRAYRTKTGSGEAIGIIPVHVDAALLDNGQQAPSLDYLRGYLAGLEAEGLKSTLVRETRQQIAALEATQRGYSTAPLNVGAGGPISGIPPQGPPPAGGVAAGAASIQINEVERPRVNRLDEGVRRVREAERNGW